MIPGVGGIAVRALAARYDRSLARRPLLHPTARRHPSAGSGPLNFLLVGWDQGRVAVPPHAAAIMVLHVSADRDRAHLVALPGDLMVDLPRPPGSHHPSGADVLASALERADGIQSAQLLSAAVARLTGVQFDGAAILDIAAFHPVIDMLGGIELDSAADAPGPAGAEPSTPTTAGAEPSTPVTTGSEPSGSRRMDGRDAVDYLRQHRDERHRQHQQVWRATAARIADFDLLSNPLRIDQVIRAVRTALVVDTNGLGLDELVDVLGNLRPEHVTGVQLPVQPLTADPASPRVLDAEGEELSGRMRGGDVAAWARQNPYWVNDL